VYKDHEIRNNTYWSISWLFVPVVVIPIGIDPDKFTRQLRMDETVQKIEEFRELFEGKKVILGVDRLDYIKGIPQRLRAFGRLLQKFPEWKGKVVLIQIAVPSRTDVDKYKALKDEVEQLVAHINGTYGEFGYTPVVYQFRSVNFPELCHCTGSATQR